MSVSNKLLMCAGSDGGDTGILPEAVSFDGENDYLSRSSDLVGNTDSKTFTFSCWVYWDGTTSYVYDTGSRVGNGVFFLRINSNGSMTILARNASNTIIINGESDSSFAKNTWNHILISGDLLNTKSHLYINDNLVTYTPSPFTNDSIDFTQTEHVVMSFAAASFTKYKGRLAHLFLDYTYRDLSIEANRRLFITDDLKPAYGQASLAPILYLPMTDVDTAGTNLGTGGDFTVNGTLDQAARGPNQWNCVASKFDGTDDYLSSTGIGASDGKQFTFSATGHLQLLSRFFAFGTVGTLNNYFEIKFNDVAFYLSMYNSSGSKVLNLTCESELMNIIDKFFSISISVDMSNTAKRIISVNGEIISGVWDIYNDINLKFSGQQNYLINSNPYNPTIVGTCSIGELYFDTNYIDLSTNNPFWDSNTNKPKPIRQVLEETGNTPLIAMPISANNPGLNLGTGGDFTLNGGGLTGARGASEFWTRSALVTTDAAGSLTAPFSGSDGQIVSFFICFNILSDSFYFAIADTVNVQPAFRIRVSPSSGSLGVGLFSDGGLQEYDRSYSGTVTGWNTLVGSIDLSDNTKDNLYLNGIEVAASTIFDVGEFIDFSGADQIGLFQQYSSRDGSGNIASVYFTTDYIDFSQESNRNLFVDQLGYPKDLTQAIDNGDIPEPLIYLPFDDPDDLGKNLGTGGDFTVNGTVTAGSDFSI